MEKAMLRKASFTSILVAFAFFAAGTGIGGAPATSTDEAGHTRYAVANASPELVAAIRANDIARVKAILATGVKIDSEQDDSLGIAIHASSDRIVELLLHAGANVNSKDAYGCTPLTWAVYEDRADIVNRLLERGARLIRQPERCP